ncbi:phosphoglucomutase [Paenibacillus selenitireducens]|uniref:Phosphoglucomutase n=1 Tax=Paenibacillus selenitireducens TaxID=1324314 RepID=A0A1T2XAJ3_9BACL|nr:phosphoglucomutase [Paenibacillus selenitireducens]OPA76613.1 phosphoglucomutase [Paenibacillus selenitireducens]
MSYPDQVDQFTDKLNKKLDGSVYVIEEILTITGGLFEGLLAHDNITNNSIRVYTGPKLTGKEITDYVISIPSDTPWRRSIKIFADVPKVYVTYETDGDIVEADDINQLQVSITSTQAEIERYKEEGIIDGGYFSRGK